MDTPIRLFILHRHCVFTDALAGRLKSHSRFYPLRRFAQVGELLAALAVEPADVVLVERSPENVFLPDMIRDLKIEFPQVKVLPLELKNDELIGQCRAAGATDFVPPNASLARLIDLVVRAHKLKEDGVVRTRKRKEDGAGTSPEAKAIDPLTARQFEVLVCISTGMTNPQIARKLEISPSTVRNHVHDMLERLDLKNRYQAVSWAREKRLLPLA